MIEFKGSHFEGEVILWGVRWYVAYPISYRNLEEMLEERGVEVDHSTLNRWVVKYSSQLVQAFVRRKRSVGTSWRMDETYVKVKGKWKYLYRAVDKEGQTIDFLLTAQRDKKAASRFLTKAIRYQGVPEKITIDKSGANTAAIEGYNTEGNPEIELRQIKYLNNSYLLLLAAAGRDEQAKPDAFLLERPERQLFGFGHGHHACPGQDLANAIATTAIQHLLALAAGRA